MRFFAISVSVFVAIVVVFGFRQIGTPQSAREAKLDRALIDRLSQAEYRVREHIEFIGTLPDTLETEEDIRYERRDERTFAFCATFHTASESSPPFPKAPPIRTPDKESIIIEPWDDWHHPAGEHCFERRVTRESDT